jgi:hypothetical protein
MGEYNAKTIGHSSHSADDIQPFASPSANGMSLSPVRR